MGDSQLFTYVSSDIGIAILIAAGISVLIGLVEVMHDAKSDFHLSFGLVLYIALLALGNVVTTILSSQTLPEPFVALPWLWYAFSGVFGFQILIRNTNVTILDKGVLTIEQWISKAKDVAVGKAIELHAQSAQDLAVTAAQQLSRLDVDTLNTFVITSLGSDVVAILDSKAKAAGADLNLYKALAVAQQKPSHTKAYLKSLQTIQ